MNALLFLVVICAIETLAIKAYGFPVSFFFCVGYILLYLISYKRRGCRFLWAIVMCVFNAISIILGTALFNPQTIPIELGYAVSLLIVAFETIFISTICSFIG